jgi:hypothetical protein
MPPTGALTKRAGTGVDSAPRTSNFAGYSRCGRAGLFQQPEDAMKASKLRLSSLALLAVGVVGALLLAGCETPSSQLQKSWDGLELKQVKGVDAVYLLPGAQFKPYTTVMIDPVQVAFDKNWEPNQYERDISRHLSTKDIEKIRTEMSQVFREVFVEELQKGGYTVVQETSPETLRVSPGLANVYITAPDKMAPGRSYTLTSESGRMTLVMELRDGSTAQLIGRVLDTKVGDNFGRMMITDSVTNSADFRQAVRQWASRLRQGLDNLKAGVAPPPPA